MSTLTITDTDITSDSTRHTASVVPGVTVEGGPTAWSVSWLPGRAFTRNQAITAMTVAEIVVERARVLADPESKLWWHMAAWAAELGITTADAAVMAALPPGGCRDGGAVSGYAWRGKKPVNPCACGCGMEVSIATRSGSRNGQVKGQPLRYVSGHNPTRKSPAPPAADAAPSQDVRHD